MSQLMTEFAGELLKAWNGHDIETVAALYAPDYEGRDVGQAGQQRGPDDAGRAMARYLRAFPDLRIIPEVTTIQGDRLALVWTAQGTHRGKFMNIPPTGRPVTVLGASVLTVVNGKIRQAWVIWDVAELLRSLGLLPEL